MFRISDEAGLPAINGAAKSGSDKTPTAASGSDDEKWLKSACSGLLGKDAGLHLHYITGYPERSCYYYAKGEREPSTDFLRALFRSPQGLPFFRAFMHGCEAEWWRDLEQSEQRAISAEQRLQSITEIIRRE